MKKCLYLLCAATLTLFACNKVEGLSNGSDTEVIDVGGEELSFLTINLSGFEQTKASSVNDTYTNKYWVYVYNTSSGLLETAAEIASSGSNIQVTKGDKTVCVIGNPSSINEGTFSDISNHVSYSISQLEQLAVDGLSMYSTSRIASYGKNTVSVTGATASVSVQLQRCASKVVVNNIQVSTSANPVLENYTIKLKEVYMDNVARTCPLNGVPTAAQTTASVQEIKSENWNGLASQEYHNPAIALGSFSPVTFYCLPNYRISSTKDTMLGFVFEFTNNTTSEATDYYYLVSFGCNFVASKVYTIDTITVQNFGTTTAYPSTPSEQSALTANISIKPWTTGSTISPTI